jgi:hypothetical protein
LLDEQLASHSSSIEREIDFWLNLNGSVRPYCEIYSSNIPVDICDTSVSSAEDDECICAEKDYNDERETKEDITPALDYSEFIPFLDESEEDEDESKDPSTNKSNASTCTLNADPTDEFLVRHPNNGSSISQVSSREESTDSQTAASSKAIKIYFKLWNVCTILAFLFNIFNMKWKLLVERESWLMITFAFIFVLIQGVLQWSVLEIPLMSFATLLVKPIPDQKACGKDLTVVINYNLLASNEDEVDATLKNAYDAYIGNLSPSVVAIMVSATGKRELKDYEIQCRDNCRERIYDIVLEEGRKWADGNTVDIGRALRCFEPYRNNISGVIDINFLDTILPSLAIHYANNFMVIQRVTRSLRKCGQYQDLMLLSEGCNEAWTYTDNKLYNEMARKYGEHVFYPSDDVDNTQGREFDYVLVLDGDTGVVKDSLSVLMDVAAANRHRAILQPSIKITATEDQSLFMHIDAIRQEINEPVSAALTTLLGRSGFFGKGLLQSKLYIRAMLGDQANPIEKVPIDVLSHDTFEAAALSPLYVNSVHLLEEPCGNYVTWDIRECRWNRGELILSHYFFPETFGRFFTWLMHMVRDKPPVKLTLRTDTHLDEAGAYIAHSALRQMLLKPTLLLYITGRTVIRVYLRNDWIVVCSVMFAVIVLPKFAIIRRNNLHKIVAETIFSILQFTPEPIMGTLRDYKACRAHITGISGWVPQFKVEQDFLISPALIASFRYQWRVFLLTIAALIPIVLFKPKDFFLQSLFVSTALLPIYTTLTALPYSTFKRAL